MRKRVIQVANKVSFGVGNMLLTSVNGNFLNSYSVVPMEFLKDDIEGSSQFNHAVLVALLPYRKELLEGKQVDVYIEEKRDKQFVSYEPVDVIIVKTWELVKKLSNEELVNRFKNITDVFGEQYYLHKSGNVYYSGTACTINKDGSSWMGMTYYPVSKEGEILKEIVHTRPMDEFLSSKFTMVDRFYHSFQSLKEVLSTLRNFTLYAAEFEDKTWSYSFLPIIPKGTTSGIVKVDEVKVEEGVIAESTIAASTVGKAFQQIYKTSTEINQFLTEK